MSKDFNIQQLQGRLVRDPEARVTPNGKTVVRIDLAYNGRHKTDGEGSFTSFIQVEIWEELADYAVKNFRKGMLVIVKGDLVQNRWRTPEGKGRSTFKIVARVLETCDLKNRPEIVVVENAA